MSNIENGRRPHDQHCAWCDCEEFVAVKYGTLHHLTERAVKTVRESSEHHAANGLPIDGYPKQEA